MCFVVVVQGDAEKQGNTAYGVGSEATGPCIIDIVQFDSKNLAVVTDGVEKKYLTYSNDKRLYLKSGETVGTIQMYPSKIPNGAPNILVKKGEVVENVIKA